MRIDLRAFSDRPWTNHSGTFQTVILVDIKAGGTLIRRFKRESYALMYLVHDRDACTEVAFPMVTFDVYRLLKSPRFIDRCPAK